MSKRNEKIHKVLAAHFPKCFYQKSEPKKPIKVGIHLDICKFFPELNPKHLRRALAAYTATASYRASMVAGAPRFDLNGNVSGNVTETEANITARKVYGCYKNATPHYAKNVAVSP